MKHFPRRIVRFQRIGNSCLISIPKDMRNEMGFRPGDFALVTLVDDCLIVDRLDPNSVRTMQEAREAVEVGRLPFSEKPNGRTTEQRA